MHRPRRLWSHRSNLQPGGRLKKSIAIDESRTAGRPPAHDRILRQGNRPLDSGGRRLHSLAFITRAGSGHRASMARNLFNALRRGELKNRGGRSPNPGNQIVAGLSKMG